MAFSKKSIVIAGAGSATLATAVSNYNTAIATGITTALAVQGISVATLSISPANSIFDGTLYVFSGTVSYNTN